MEYYYCLTHLQVEQGPGCAGMNRLGPYGSFEEAAGAPQRAAERTAQRDAEDAAEDDWGRR